VEAPAPSSPTSYTVRAGDTLDSIARDLGVPIEALAHQNGIRNTSRIHVGQRLELPRSPEIPGAEPPLVTALASVTIPDAAPTTDASAPAPDAVPRTYTVRRGDSLDSISRELGVPIEVLAERNGIRNKSRIDVGQQLELPDSAQAVQTAPLLTALATVPPSSDASAHAAPESSDAPKATSYTVRRGDTLHSISRKLGISVEELAERNGIRNKSRIDVGQRLELPEPPAPPVPEASPAPAPETSVSPSDAPASGGLETVVAQ
jgi:LysM repeat protein